MSFHRTFVFHKLQAKRACRSKHHAQIFQRLLVQSCEALYIQLQVYNSLGLQASKWIFHLEWLWLCQTSHVEWNWVLPQIEVLLVDLIQIQPKLHQMADLFASLFFSQSNYEYISHADKYFSIAWFFPLAWCFTVRMCYIQDAHDYCWTFTSFPVLTYVSGKSWCSPVATPSWSTTERLCPAWQGCHCSKNLISLNWKQTP